MGEVKVLSVEKKAALAERFQKECTKKVSAWQAAADKFNREIPSLDERLFDIRTEITRRETEHKNK